MFLKTEPTSLTHERAVELAATLNSDPEDYWSYEAKRVDMMSFSRVLVIDEEGHHAGYL